jgi:uncharacterized membrane protein YgdD (TMEM256/DUF423 family)
LFYFAVRLLLIFRGGKKKKPWLYVSVGSLALAAGTSLFSLYLIFELPSFVHTVGGVVSMIGGVLLLAGLRSEYRSWRAAG